MVNGVLGFGRTSGRALEQRIHLARHAPELSDHLLSERVDAGLHFKNNRTKVSQLLVLVQGVGCRVSDVACRVQSAGCRV